MLRRVTAIIGSEFFSERHLVLNAYFQTKSARSQRFATFDSCSASVKMGSKPRLTAVSLNVGYINNTRTTRPESINQDCSNPAHQAFGKNNAGNPRPQECDVSGEA